MVGGNGLLMNGLEVVPEEAGVHARLRRSTQAQKRESPIRGVVDYQGQVDALQIARTEESAHYQTAI
jgi:hypothetical protein